MSGFAFFDSLKGTQSRVRTRCREDVLFRVHLVAFIVSKADIWQQIIKSGQIVLFASLFLSPLNSPSYLSQTSWCFPLRSKRKRRQEVTFLDYLKGLQKMEPFKSSLLHASWCQSCSVVRYPFKLCKWVHIYPFMWDFYLIRALPSSILQNALLHYVLHY